MYRALRNFVALILVLAAVACGSSDSGPSSTGNIDPDLVKEYLLMHPDIVFDDEAVSDAIRRALLRRGQGRVAEERQSILSAHQELLVSRSRPLQAAQTQISPLSSFTTISASRAGSVTLSYNRSAPQSPVFAMYTANV